MFILKKKVFQLNNKQELIFKIYDTSGSERFTGVVKSHISNANGVILTYNITKKETFEKVKFWLKEVRDNFNMKIPIILVGSMKDMENNREITVEEGQKFANDNNLIFYESSAKDDINTDLIFSHLFCLIFNEKINDFSEEEQFVFANEMKLYDFIDFKIKNKIR